jgi:hypothetical protein
MDRKGNGKKWSWLYFRWLFRIFQEGLNGTAVTSFRITCQDGEG